MEADPQGSNPIANNDKKISNEQEGNLAEQRLKITPQQSLVGEEESENGSSDSERDFQEEFKSQKPISEKKTEAEGEEESEQIRNTGIKNPNSNGSNRRRRYIKNFRDLDQTYLKHEHRVEDKTLILIWWMYRYNRDFSLEELAGLEDGEIYAQTKEGKLFVKAKSKEVIKAVVERLSDFIDKLNVVAWPLGEIEVNKFIQLKKIKKELREKEVYLFKCNRGNRDRGSILLGGPIKPSQLSSILSTIKSYKVFYIHLRALRGTRTYKIIMNTILERPEVCEELSKYNQTKTVDIVHSKDFEMKLVICTFSRKNVPPQDYEEFMMNIMKRYLVLVFAFQTENCQIPKLKSPNSKITFKIIPERRFKASYLMVLCPEKVFYEFQKDIAAEIEKIGQYIYGIRFFNYIRPTMSRINFNKDKYFFVGHPKNRPYSNTVFARTKYNYTFDWKDFYNRAVDLNNEKRIKQQAQ